MDSSELKAVVLSAFDHVGPPDRDAIAPHRCPECDEIVESFAGKTVSDLSDETLLKHCWDLPLFSAEAKRFFLPAWMLKALEDPDSDFTDALIYNFEKDHRNDGYTESQRSAIRCFLAFVALDIDEHSLKSVQAAQDRWR